MAAEETPTGTPVSRLFEARLSDFLADHIGEEITPEFALKLGNVMLSTELEFVNISQAGRVLGVTPQRVRQLIQDEKMPEPAGTAGDSKFWLTGDVEEFREERQPLVDLAISYLQRD